MTRAEMLAAQSDAMARLPEPDAYDCTAYVADFGGCTQYGVRLPDGTVKTYADQAWVKSGDVIRDAHPDGVLVSRRIVVTAQEWGET